MYVRKLDQRSDNVDCVPVVSSLHIMLYCQENEQTQNMQLEVDFNSDGYH